jgi:hypothetical protein
MPEGDRAARLRRVLEKEASALRNGDFAALDGLVREKESLCRDPGPLRDMPMAVVQDILRLARRNDALVAAARGGLRAAMERLGDVSCGGASLRTYDKSGATALLAAAPVGPIRRA